MSGKNSIVEQKAKNLIKLRKYKMVKRPEFKEGIGFLVRTQDKNKILIWGVPDKSTIGVAYVNQLGKAMKEINVDNGIIVGSGRYTQAAKLNANKKGIELLPKTFPIFNIFEHELVPKHEILSEKERENLLNEYRVKPYQLPRILASDPAVIAIGAKPGNIVKIVRESTTAGKHVSYRYVVEG